MQEKTHWLTLLLEGDEHIEGDEHKWPHDLKGYRISLDTTDTLQECNYPHPFRTSPIFPLADEFIKPDLDCYNIYFYTFHPAFPTLGRIQNSGSEELTRRTWYTIGLASVLLITGKEEMNQELLDTVGTSPQAIESWSVEENRIKDIVYKINAKDTYDYKQLSVHGYKHLPVTDKAVVDEFIASISLIAPKIALHIPCELEVFVRLVEQVNELVDELEYLHSLEGQIRDTLILQRNMGSRI